MPPLPRKTLLAIALCAAMMAGLRFVPALSWFRPPSARTIAGIVRTQPAEPAAEPSTEPPKSGPPTPEPPKPEAPPIGEPKPTPEPPARPDFVSAPGFPRVTDPAGALGAFHEALATAKAPVKVLHYGDSPTTADSITADVRALLQARHGDAGHGFLLVAKPWAWYGHRGVTLKAEGWITEAASQGNRAKDGFHGLGGVNQIAYPGAYSTVTLPDDAHRKVEVHYLTQPGGGDFKIDANQQTVLQVRTGGAERANGFASAALPPATKSVKLTVTRGMVRVYGWTFEKEQPGVIYSSIGLNGASVQTLVYYFNTEHWSDQLRHQAPALVVLNYGSNESVNREYVEKYYRGELRRLVDRVRAALPQSSILIMSPMDRGQRDAMGGIVTVPTVPRIVEIQQEVALEKRCAFFNTYIAMGGSGTMAKWYAANPRLVSADFLHPTPPGAAKVGALLDQALSESFQRWKAHR